jgi:hypothetical protein
MRHHTVAGLVAKALVGVGAIATNAVAAEPSTRECLAANEQAITLREQHRLIAARETLLVCASATCHADIRDECNRQVAEVTASIPSIIFEAKDGNGNDLSVVKVTMDGKPFASELSGTAVSVDPGPHTFVFETEGQSPLEKKIVLVEGTRDRHETVVFGSAAVSRTPEPDRGPSDKSNGGNGTGQRIIGFSMMGLGVAGVVVGVVFELQRSNALRDRDAICPTGTCPNDQLGSSQARVSELTSNANRDGTIGIVGFAAGGALLAGGLAVVLTAPSGSGAVAVAPVVTRGFGGVAASGRF